MNPDQLAKIEQNASYFAARTDADLHQLVGQDVPALVALVREQQARIDSADQAFIDWAQATGGLLRAADEITHVCRIMSALRGHETPHRVAYNRVWAEVERVKADAKALTADRDRARDVAVALEQETAAVTRHRDYLKQRLDAVTKEAAGRKTHGDRLKAERDAAHAYARRLLAERDTVARTVRSPHLTDAEKLAEIREAFAVVEGQREEANR